MRRNMEFVRQLLIDISENRHSINNEWFKDNQNGLRKALDDEFFYHLIILKEAGYIEYVDFQGSFKPILTWLGNELLDAIENETVWSKTKKFAKERGFDVAKMSIDTLLTLTKQQVGIVLGLEK